MIARAFLAAAAVLAPLAACATPPPTAAHETHAALGAHETHDSHEAHDASAKAASAECAGDDFGLPATEEAAVAARFAKKRGTMGVATKHMVASSHRLATEAGLAVLRSGGTAADAFVAATLVQDVVLPGVTSTAGIAGILVYEAKTKKLTYVHGGVADPIAPERRRRTGENAAGKLVLVPGAPAAYAELAKRFGKKPLAELVEPAARLAAKGFPADALYARSIAREQAKLATSAYGKKAFFHDGKPVAQGETLVLEDLARTLRSYGKDPTFFHRGAWAREAVALANAHGGSLTIEDFQTYAPEIAAPIHGRFMGHDLYAAGHGGAKVLMSLSALERLRGGEPAAPPWASAPALETLLRVRRAATGLPLLHDRALVTMGETSEPAVMTAAATIEATVRAGLVPPVAETPGTHSSAVVVVDAEGNIVVGTHTIETLNWGEGLFVGGVPLSTSAGIAFDAAAAATKRVRIDPLSATIVMRDGTPRAALTVYGTGLHPADVQILDAVIARGVDAEAAVLEPRVGNFSFDLRAMKMDESRTTVDPRFDRGLLCALKQRGFTLERSMPGMAAGFVDTGFPTLVTIAPGGGPGRLHGMTPEPSHIEGVAAGD